LTDVEGDAQYLDRYVKQSRVLEFIPTKPRWGDRDSALDFPEEFSSLQYFPYHHCIDFASNTHNSMLIYGGDMWDKGGSDLYVIRQLLDLKRRYPTRVHFLMGNRDLNKMRIAQEMGMAGEELPPHNGSYWLRNYILRMGGDPNNPVLKPSSTSAVERLQWILGRTMGSPNAFQLRKQELQRERQQQAPHHPSSTPTVTDEDVVESYRKSCHPRTGEMGNYLSNAHLALRIGQLFLVHGALPLKDPILTAAMEKKQDPTEFWKDVSFAQPWNDLKKTTTTLDTPEQAIQHWLESLPQFTQRGLQAWKEEYDANQKEFQSRKMWIPTWLQPLARRLGLLLGKQQQPYIWAEEGGYPSDRPHGQLMQYGMGSTPDGIPNPSVVYASWSTDGSPQRFDPELHKNNPKYKLLFQLVQEFFRQTKIKLILCGHQPQGDAPWPIRIPNNNNANDINTQPLGYVVCCDTSYSGDTQWFHSPNTPDPRMNLGRGTGAGFRGDVAVTEVLVELDLKESGGVLEKVYWHGVLSDGTLYETSNLLDQDDNTRTGTIASGDWVPSKEETPEQTKWWTKIQGRDGFSLITTAKGYNVTNYVVEGPGAASKGS
jgi:hypothetical protein